MAFLDGTTGFAIAVLAGLVLLNYAGLIERIKIPAGFIAAGALLYFVENATTMALGTLIGDVATWLTLIWNLLALVFIVIGSLWALVDFITKPKTARR